MLRSEITHNFLELHKARLTKTKGMLTHVIVTNDSSEDEYPITISSDESDEKQLSYDIDKYWLAIGFTGWSWENEETSWVAFDFDSLIGHKAGLTDTELDETYEKLKGIDWVSVYQSKSGKGYHVYVNFDQPIHTTKKQHGYVAKAILAKMSALTGYNFISRVDICGGVMWSWHKDQVSTAFQCLKEGCNYTEEINWQNYEDAKPRAYDDLVIGRLQVKADTTLPQFLENSNAHWWWDNDKNLLVTHTQDLKAAYNATNCRGLFETDSSGTTKYNCFCFPLEEGGWVVRRFGKGVTEHSLWETDASGWTYCYFNVQTSFRTACRFHGGIEIPSGGYHFDQCDMAILAIEALGISHDIPSVAIPFKCTLKEHKDGRLIVIINDKDNVLQNQLKTWLRDKTSWKKMYSKRRESMRLDEETVSADDLIRHLVSEDGQELGWAVNTGKWIFEPLQHIRLVLTAKGYSPPEINNILGNCILKNWTLTSEPFADEYPGGRKWNLDAPKLRFLPIDCKSLDECPTWYKVLHHIGKGLDYACKENEWCRENGINGTMYLTMWFAAFFQEPEEPLPYLFLYGVENTGKTSFQQYLARLFIHGYILADQALEGSNNFNAELQGGVLCVIEETDLSKDKKAFNRMKAYVTNPIILVHKKGLTPYNAPNTTHWIQTNNDVRAAPVFAGDTRVTMINVSPLKNYIQTRVLNKLLDEEAGKFLGYLLNLRIPESPDRLRIPVILTEDKISLATSNQTPLEEFITSELIRCDGQIMDFSDFHQKFLTWLGLTNEMWSAKRVSSELSPDILKGRSTKTNQLSLGNVTFDKSEKPDGVYHLLGGKLKHEVAE